jgi:hypothetical protein
MACQYRNVVEEEKNKITKELNVMQYYLARPGQSIDYKKFNESDY